LLAIGLDPTRLLIISQVVLSFGIPFALVPLVRIAGDSSLMELAPSRRSTVVLAWLVVAIVVTFNVALIVLLLLGR
jgi:manganese transport protein